MLKCLLLLELLADLTLDLVRQEIPRDGFHSLGQGGALGAGLNAPSVGARQHRQGSGLPTGGAGTPACEVASTMNQPIWSATG